MEFHNQEFGLAFRPSSMSHTHDSSAMQLGTSDVKSFESRAQPATQSLTEGTKAKGATIKLVSRPKSSHPEVLPSYNYASKYPLNGKVEKPPSAHAHQVACGSKSKHADPNKSLSKARRGKTSKQPDEEAAPIPPCQIIGIPVTMFTLKTPPSQEKPLFFSGYVKGYRTLEYHHVNGERPAFLDLSLASGDWSTAWVHVLTLEGDTLEHKQLYNKVTWGDVMDLLVTLHPTGTHFDVPEGEDEFFDVGISLCYSEL